ncbi:hypothetical protein J6W78_00435 [bacterium]|nr:hypothetical protein [bacterium]
MKHRISVQCTDEQYEKIVKKAEDLDMSPKEFALFTMLNSQIKVVIGQDPLLAKIERAVNLLDCGKIDEKEFEIIKERLFSEIRDEKN